MANLAYTTARRTDNLHTVTRSAPAAVASAGTPTKRLDITLGTNPSDTNTITIGDGTATVVFEFDTPDGVSGGNTAVTIGGTATITAASLATAVDASALSADLVVTNPSAGVVRLEWTTALTISVKTVGASNITVSESVSATTLTAISVAPALLVFDSTATKSALRDAWAAIKRAVDRDFSKSDAPADIATSGSSLE